MVRLIAIFLFLANTAVGAQPGDKMDQLKVIDFNVWHALDAIGTLKFGTLQKPEEIAARHNRAIDDLINRSADIIFLQEMNPAASEAKRWAEALDMDYIHQVDNCGLKIFGWGPPLNLHSGLVILAKKELHLKRIGHQKLSGHMFGFCGDQFSLQFKEFRYALGGTISWEGETLLLTNTHLHHFVGGKRWEDKVSALNLPGARTVEIQQAMRNAELRRMTEVDVLLDKVFEWKEATNAKRVLIAGDFNAVPEARELIKMHIRFNEFGQIQKKTFGEEPFITFDSNNNPFPLYSEKLKSNINPQPGEEGIAALLTERHSEPRRIDLIWGQGLEPCSTLKKIPQDVAPFSDHFGIEVQACKSN